MFTSFHLHPAVHVEQKETLRLGELVSFETLGKAKSEQNRIHLAKCLPKFNTQLRLCAATIE